ncbi:MAG: ribulokinase [Ruminococcaceae bacterium]|nr:ribulokinase [Oscillospiraceae bacterium]
MAKYSIGIDYGTLSARALLLNLDNGAECAEAVYEYPHAVMSEKFLDGTPLPPDFALQHPRDYLEALKAVIPAVLNKAGAAGSDVVGIGVDFTSCTVVPAKADGTPLCFDEAFKYNKHAYAKLWKHHAATPYADKMSSLLAGSELLARFGGKFSNEFLFPKLAEIADHAPEVFDAADVFLEGGDFMTWTLTGHRTMSRGIAGFKAMYTDEDGFPSNEVLTALHPLLDGVVTKKLTEEISYPGESVGGVTEAWAEKLGVPVGTPVSAALIDAHAAVPAAGIVDGNEMLFILGTSGVQMVMSDEVAPVGGICGITKHGYIRDRYAYEAGQVCLGDHFDWFVKNGVPSSYTEEAKEKGVGIHALLTEKASRLSVGESGLLALDWWNGNRSILVEPDLSGMILGISLSTKPEHIYRALIEGTAFSTRRILDAFEEAGVSVGNILVGGGIAEKNPLLMQIYADVTERELRLVGTKQAGALGSAIYGAVAGGAFPTVKEAASVLAKQSDTVYRPIPENVSLYRKLYAEYKTLHDYFGKGENDVMKRLKAMKTEK